MKNLMKKKIKIGTRGSLLALKQSQIVQNKIENLFKDVEVEIVKIKTKGDKILDLPLAKIGGKGLFVKEIEEAIIDRRIDIAVHSLKDLPYEIPKGLVIKAVLERENPSDAFISTKFKSIMELENNSKIGTSSLRRISQLKSIKPLMEIVPLRGNVDTRIKKLEMGLDGIILAVSGIERLGLSNKITEIIPVDILIPACGQGAIAVECRKDDKEIEEILKTFDHKETRICVEAERTFSKALGGSCQVPLGCYAEIDGGGILIRGFVGSIDGKNIIRKKIKGNITEGITLAKKLSEMILQEGGREILSMIFR